MANSVGYNQEGTHTLGYSCENDEDEPLGIEISTNNEPGKISIILYDRVSKKDANIDVGGEDDLLNHFTDIQIPIDKRIELANYLSQVSQMLMDWNQP